MTLTELLQILGTVLGISAVLAVLVGNVFYVLRSQTGKIQREQLHQLKAEIATCEAKHQDSQKDIHRLQGQIEVLQNIPLKDINQDIASIEKTNKQILNTLQKSADTLKQNTKEEVDNRKIVANKPKEA